MRATACVLLAMTLVGCALCAPPGLEATLGANLINNLWTKAAAIGLPQLQSISIPDVSGSTGTAIGTIEYSVSNIVISQVAIQSTSATLRSGEGLDLSASGLSLHVDLNFHYKEKSFPHISGSASATVKVSNGGVSLVALPTNGHLEISLTSESVSLGDFDIDVHGSLSWFYNFIESIFKGQIKSMCEKAVKDSVAQQIPQLNAYLQSLPTTYSIDMWQGSHVTVDYSVVQAPAVTSSYMFLDALGSFSADGKGSQCPYTPPSMPQVAAGSDVQIFVADFVENCFLYSLYTDGLLTKTLDSSMVPSSSPIQLNTTDLKSLEPNLYAKYPDRLIEIVVRATDAPMVQNTANTTKITAPIALDWYAVLENGTNAFAFTLTSNAELSFNLQVKEDTTSGNLVVSGSLSDSNITFSVSKSDVGTVQVDGLNGLVQLGLALGQGFLNKGYPLPPVNIAQVGTLKFTNPVVQQNEGYVLVSFNVVLP